MSPRKWDFRLEDMVKSARKIMEYVEGLTFEDFASDEKTFDAVIRQLIILGEAASHVPDKLSCCAPAIPWSEIRGIRNIIVHEYFGVNIEIIWNTATNNIKELLPMLESLQRQVANGNQGG